MTLSPDQEWGRKRFGPFHLYQKNNTKNNNQPKSFSLAYTSFGFLTNKKVIFLPATVQAGQTQNRSHEQVHSQFIQDPDMKPFVFLILCLFGLKILHKMYDFRFQREWNDYTKLISSAFHCFVQIHHRLKVPGCVSSSLNSDVFFPTASSQIWAKLI